MDVIQLTKENFEREVLHSEQPVLVDFWATWCGPCRMVSPVIDEIARETKGLKVGKINVDEQTELARQFDVMSIPTLCVFEKGQLVRRVMGARPKNAILKLIQG